jgi:hypothetical protein
MIKTTVPAIVAAMLLGSQPAEAAAGWQSGMNGDELLENCVQLGNNEPCIAFVFGIADMLNFPEAEYTWPLDEERRLLTACIPDGELPGDVVSNVALHIQDQIPRPEHTLPAFWLVLRALMAEYPCTN